MAEQSAGWQIPGFLETRAGHLTVDGLDAIALIEQYGSPLYVFSEKRLAEHVGYLRRAIEAVHPRVKLCYASKANSNMAVLSAVRRAGGDIEVNSGGELHKARVVGFRPDQIVFNGVSKTDEEIRAAVEYGILALNVDSLFELEQVARVARSTGKRANVAIRIVPEIITRSHIGLQTGLLSSKFGLSPAQIEEAFRIALANHDAINLAGAHIHVGSQTPDPQPFARAFAEMWLFLLDLYRKTGHRLSHINIGGGLPVNYLQDTPMAESIGERERQMLSATLDPGEVMRAAINEAVTGSERALFEELTIVMEPGRRIVADTGLLLTRVCNVKERPETGDTWLLTDAGYSLALSMAMYKWYYHLVSASRAAEAHARPFKVAGPLCDSGDVYFDLEKGTRLPNYRLLPAATTVGDVLALLNAGAYALDQASQYNGRPIPAVVMITEAGEVKLTRRRQTYEDLYAQDEW
ncbi:MAG TPA: diaminopimelate decarboxylase [Blastocatellia bacterium]|nr:diaminopimelate decarboxylase [Blastocatellia bacterium]